MLRSPLVTFCGIRSDLLRTLRFTLVGFVFVCVVSAEVQCQNRKNDKSKLFSVQDLREKEFNLINCCKLGSIT